MASHASCIFCKIIKGEIPSFKLIETAKTYSFLDIQPIAEAHVLIILNTMGQSCTTFRRLP